MKKSKITILFWVLVFSFMYLVSVDAKDRSLDFSALLVYSIYIVNSYVPVLAPHFPKNPTIFIYSLLLVYVLIQELMHLLFCTNDYRDESSAR